MYRAMYPVSVNDRAKAGTAPTKSEMEYFKAGPITPDMFQGLNHSDGNCNYSAEFLQASSLLVTMQPQTSRRLLNPGMTTEQFQTFRACAGPSCNITTGLHMQTTNSLNYNSMGFCAAQHTASTLKQQVCSQQICA